MMYLLRLYHKLCFHVINRVAPSIRTRCSSLLLLIKNAPKHDTMCFYEGPKNPFRILSSERESIKEKPRLADLDLFSEDKVRKFFFFAY